MEKKHIILLGRRNNGKSSLINAFTGQQTAIVSEIPGTTTDPVKKSYEIPGFASVIFIDTAGSDDQGILGQKRTEKTFQALTRADLAIVTISANQFGEEEEKLIERLKKFSIPFIIVHTKSDLIPLKPALKSELEQKYRVPVKDFSIRHPEKCGELIGELQNIAPLSPHRSLLGDILEPNDILLLVTPIDSEAPVGRLILPQVQMIRDILDNRCISVVLQPEEIPSFLKTGLVPRLTITDSQAFKRVSELLPVHWPLTSFSIVLARHKGNFEKYLQGTKYIRQLSENDRILMLESCSHHVSCEDIGRVKIPALLQKFTNLRLNFDFIAGLDPIPRSVKDYALIIQCGGCMVTAKQLENRLLPFLEAGVPVSNYGMTLAYIQGIFGRAVAPLTSS